LRRCLSEPRDHGEPIESNVSPEAQARDRIAAADAGFFIDPGFRNLQAGGDFFGRENVFGLEAWAYVGKVKAHPVGNLGLIAKGAARPRARTIKEVTHRVHV